MDKLREFYECVYDLDEEALMIKMLECLDHIRNKLLVLDDNNKKIYCRMIVSHTWDYLSGLEDFPDVFIGEDLEHLSDRVHNSENLGTEMLFSFFIWLSDSFYLCGISLNNICEELNCPVLLPNEYSRMSYEVMRNGLRLDATKKSGGRKKTAEANITEQADVIRTLIKSAGLKYNSDSNLSVFISWLCGGNSESIRQKGLSQNTGFQNEETLKEKFSIIGLTYEKGNVNNE